MPSLTLFSHGNSERNIEEMEYSIKNLRTTLSLNPSCEKLAKIIAEDEKYLQEMKGDTKNGR